LCGKNKTKQKAKMGNWIQKEVLENEEEHDEKNESTNSKVVVADCDPRSPTNGIVR